MPCPPPAARPSWRGLERGFTLLELVMVVALLGILAAMSIVNVRAALLMTRVTATTAELKLLRDGLLTLGIDCGTLPRWTAVTDPGLSFRPTWAAACWRGPYLSAWLARAPAGGRYRFVGQRNRKPIIRVDQLEGTAAQSLAAAIRRQFGAAALSAITRSGATWTVDMIVLDGVTIP